MENDNINRLERLAILETKMESLQDSVNKKFQELSDKIDTYQEASANKNNIEQRRHYLDQEIEDLKADIDKQYKLIKWITSGITSALITIVVYLLGV